MVAMRIWGWFLAFGIGVGCSLEGYTCEQDADCVRDRQYGICQAQGACSFPDETCLTGQRFGEAGPIDIAGVCVPPTAANGDVINDEPDGDPDGDDDHGDDGPSAGGNTGGSGEPPPTDDDPDMPPTDNLALHVPMNTDAALPLDDASEGAIETACDGSCPVVSQTGATFGSGRGLVVAPDPRLQTPNAFTLTMWVKPSTDGSITGSQSLVMRPSSGPYPALVMYLKDYHGDGDNDFCAGLGDASPWCEEDVIDAADWYHLALRWDGTFLELYVDGAMVHRETPPGDALAPANMWVGRAGPSTIDDFDGELSDLRVYDVALDDAALSAVMNAG